ncbi:hypothetical protein [Novipirellula artificiosorum]|uniref:Glycosyl hydrolases family 43 n=1 Tax=Novipirellula artificiosorum TaxID=2528016 RepID=A0A5C6D2I7_9BACT|nr:hypothetical protein [Novipirellula artificiosorum]TWU31152.1 hypothetical protein Poly41_63430 [Novipirellula artificiosorum]
MNRYTQFISFFTLTALAVHFFAAEGGFNPIFRDAFTADPATMVVGDTTYVYVGHDDAKEGQFFTVPDWMCYSSKDMKN